MRNQVREAQGSMCEGLRGKQVMGAGVESPRHWMLGDGCKEWVSRSVSAGASSARAGWEPHATGAMPAYCLLMYSRVVFDCHPFSFEAFPESVTAMRHSSVVSAARLSLSDRLVANSPLNAAPDTGRSVERHGAWWTGHQPTSILLASVGGERRPR
jgi:hypothetical protein